MAGAKFDHLVVLMLENRSFDHMLGRLYHPENLPPFDTPPRAQIFDGVLDSMSNSLIPALPPPIFVWRNTDYNAPGDDCVGHQFADVQAQMNPPPLGNCLMGGFVQSRNQQCQGATQAQLQSVMGGFSPSEVTRTGSNFAAASVLSSLARDYAVCDNWYCSVPGPTFPNRSFLHSGNSNGLVSNADFSIWNEFRSPTILNIMQEAGLTAGIYHSGYGPFRGSNLVWSAFPAVIYELHPTVTEQDFPRRSFEQFQDDVAAGTLPNYSFIEPSILGYDWDWLPNDQHPARDIRVGEHLVYQVALALYMSPQFDRTLLIITYDEHGGFFDHRYPPPATPPTQDQNRAGGYAFDQFGPRVPAVLVSPLIEPGTVFHPDGPVDHTSIIKTICNNWGLDASLLGMRAAAACDLSSVLGSTARLTVSDLIEPMFSPAIRQPLPLSEWQRDYVALVARNRRFPVPPLATEDDARTFLHAILAKSPHPMVDRSSPAQGLHMSVKPIANGS